MAEEVRHCEAHEVQIKQLQDSDTRQWDAIDNLQHRLPHWATLLIALLSSAVVGLLVKLSNHT